MRLSGTKTSTVSSSKGLGDQLYDLGGARPTLDLNFANNESLVDSVTGKTLVTHTRASSATYFDGDGVIQSASTDTPRFDHDPLTGESLGLLVEEARTNLVKSSVIALGNSWEAAGPASVVDLSLNELGVFSGVRVASGGQTWHAIKSNAANNGISLTANTSYTFSIWYKDGDVNPSGKIRITVKKLGVNQNSFFNRLSSDPLNIADYTISNNASHGTISSIAVTELLSSVYKVNFKFVPATTGSYQIQVGPQSDVSGESIIALGVQAEEGSFPTSYIPTNGTTVTRAGDVVEMTGTNFSSWYNQTAGTAFVSYNKPWNGNWPSYRQFFRVLNTSAPNNDNISFGITNGNGNTEVYWAALVSSVQQLQYTSYNAPGPAKYSHAVGLSTNDAAYANSGQILNTDTTVTLPVVDKAVMTQTNTHLSRITYWPTRLADATLQTITN